MSLFSKLQDQLRDLKAFDDGRPAIPGEHLLAFGLGALFLLAAAKRPSTMGKAIALAAGSALLVRAVTGRDGLFNPGVAGPLDGVGEIDDVPEGPSAE